MQSDISFGLLFLLWSTLCLGGSGGKTVCFPKYGCFTNKKPFRGKHFPLPVHPRVLQTKFYLYTKGNPQTVELLNVNDPSSIIKSQFNPNLKTVMIVHGFSHHSNLPWVIKMKNELLKRSLFNVVSVDWRKGALFSSMFYLKAVANTRLVGAQIAYLVHVLNNATGVSPQSVHIVGHSLGAHIAGYAGRRLARRNLTLGRITGLDPAKPGFEGQHVAVRLDKTDAKFVDVIHTHTAPFLFGGMGYRGHLGHVDFYPNGGEYQAGCKNIFKNIWKKGVIHALSCNHMRAVDYFTISIRQCSFMAFSCSTWEMFKEGRCSNKNSTIVVSLMGYDAGNYTHVEGQMYLKTTSTSPFCAYNYVVTIFFSKSRSKYNNVYIKLIGSQDQTRNEKLRLSEGKGDKMKFIINKDEIGALKSVEIVYYGFSSLYVQNVRVNIPHENKIYTACFNQFIAKSFWSFWQLQETKYRRKAFVGENCGSSFH